MRILIRRFGDGTFFDGRNFDATSEDAFNFREARAAIELIRAHQWPDAEIVVEYGDGSTTCVAGESLRVPEEISAAVEASRQFRRTQR